MVRTYVGAAVAVALAVPSVAQACGGFFCNSSRPVDQAAEEILFSVDGDAGTVTMHVAIQYQGLAEEFAWIVPVPGEPDLQIGTDALFPILSTLRAQFTLNRDFGDCGVAVLASPSPSTFTADSDGVGGVNVVSSGVVGPYETVVLQATDSAELLGWLQSHAFDIPDDLEPLLAPYVAEGQHFVALRLAKDKDAGDLEPLVLTYPGDALAIPIQLTSVAATPDMGLRVYVLGEDRAVPQSYLHVVLNEMAIDWWSGGANLESVITRAADEAGGHGFFTDYSGPASVVQGGLYRPAWDPVVADLATVTDAMTALQVLFGYGLPFDDALMGVLSDQLGLSDVPTTGLDLLDVLNCLSPYSYYGYASGNPDECFAEEMAAIVFDPAELAAAVEAEVLEPRRRTEALLASHTKITRLTSSLSPTEMTVDPTFVFNPSMPNVALQHTATETYLCPDGSADLLAMPRQLTLSDGRQVTLPSIQELAGVGQTEIQWLEAHALTEPATAWIEQAGPEGDPERITDNMDYLWSQLDSPILLGGVEGCGCSPVPGSGAAGLAGGIGVLILARLRRRRAG